MPYSDLNQEDLLDLLTAYDNYIATAADAGLFSRGWTPVCMGEFFENEYQSVWQAGEDFDYMYDEGTSYSNDLTAQSLADELARFCEETDTYHYYDVVDDREAAVSELVKELEAGNVAPFRNAIQEYLEDQVARTSEADIAPVEAEYLNTARRLLKLLKDWDEKLHASEKAKSSLSPGVEAEDMEAEAPSTVVISAYADTGLPHTDNADLIDSYYCVNLTVSRDWAEQKAISAGFKDLEGFLDEYTWDDTQDWYQTAFEAGALVGVNIEKGGVLYTPGKASKAVAEKRNLSPFLTDKPQSTAVEPLQVDLADGKKPDLIGKIINATKAAATKRTMGPDGINNEKDRSL